MTNIIAIIQITFSTNWTTISRTYPVLPPGVIRNQYSENQSGQVFQITKASFPWKGNEHTITLETTPVGFQLTRTIPVELAINSGVPPIPGGSTVPAPQP